MKKVFPRSKFSFLFLFIFFSKVSLAGVVVPMENILKPDMLKIDGEKKELFIVQGPEIFVYSLEGINYKIKFGKQGEGPGEFMLFPWGGGVNISFDNEFLFVGSLNKFSYFSREGKLKKEIRTEQFLLKPAILNNNIINQRDYGDRSDFIIYDLEGKEIKKICSRKMDIVKGKNIAMENHFSRVYPFFQTGDGKIFITGKKDFVIDIFSGDGIYLKSIVKNYKSININASGEKAIINYYKNHPMLKRGNAYERIKNAIEIPKYFPYYKTFLVDGKKLYVQTYRKKEGKTEFLIFSLDGSFIRETYLPLFYKDLITPYLYAINSDKLYQLVLNKDVDEYELHVTDTK